MYSIGKNLVKIREQLNLNQQQMADRVGISRVTLSNLERNHTRIINESVIRFAEANELSPEEIILGYKPELNRQTLEQARAEYSMERESLIAEYEEKLSELKAKIEQQALQISDLRDHIKTKDQIISHLRSLIPPEA